MHRLLIQRLQPFGDDAVIGAAGAETVEAGRRIGLQFGGKFGEVGKQGLAVARLGLLHLQRRLRQPVLDTAGAARQCLCQRQAKHGKRPISLDIDQPLRERAGAGRRQAAIEHQHAGQAVAILAEVGDDARGPALDQRIAEAGRVEIGNQLFARLRPFADLEADTGDHRSRRREAVAEG